MHHHGTWEHCGRRWCVWLTTTVFFSSMIRTSCLSVFLRSSTCWSLTDFMALRSIRDVLLSTSPAARLLYHSGLINVFTLTSLNPCFIKHTKPRKSSCVSFTWPSAPNRLLILPSNHSFLLYRTISFLVQIWGILASFNNPLYSLYFNLVLIFTKKLTSLEKNT